MGVMMGCLLVLHIFWTYFIGVAVKSVVVQAKVNTSSY
jgi:hypothetical protein